MNFVGISQGLSPLVPYQSMALVDAIRLGDAREIKIARDELKKRLRG